MLNFNLGSLLEKSDLLGEWKGAAFCENGLICSKNRDLPAALLNINEAVAFFNLGEIEQLAFDPKTSMVIFEGEKKERSVTNSKLACYPLLMEFLKKKCSLASF